MNTNHLIQKAIEICGSQEKLAIKAGISQSAVHKLLRSKCDPSLSTIKKIEIATGGAVKAEEFLFNHEQSHTNRQKPKLTRW